MRSIFSLPICTVALASLFLLGCSQAPKKTPTAAPSASKNTTDPLQHAADSVEFKRHRLLFVKNDDIYMCRGDGSDVHCIIHRATFPEWSPDNRKIAFCRDLDVWIADIDGKNEHRLTRTGRKQLRQIADADGRPISISWCPAPNRNVIDFSATASRAYSVRGKRAEVSGSGIFEIAADDTTALPDIIIDGSESGTGFQFSQNEFPAWSHDGEIMAFVRNGDIWYRLRAHVDTSGHQPTNSEECQWECARLSAPATFDDPSYRGSRENVGVTHICWAPDGRSLVYGVQRLGGSGTSEIYLQRVRHEKMFLSTEGEPVDLAFGFDPNFSADGKLLTWYGQSKDLQKFGVFVASPDGSNTKLIVPEGWYPVWEH